MPTPTTAKERLFCPQCGGDKVYDCTGEQDFWCPDCRKLVEPLWERQLQGEEMIRLRLENEQLKEIVRRCTCQNSQPS